MVSTKEAELVLVSHLEAEHHFRINYLIYNAWFWDDYNILSQSFPYVTDKYFECQLYFTIVMFWDITVTTMVLK